MRLLLLLTCVTGLSCGDDSGGMSLDMSAVRDLSVALACGHPGDIGNNLGVGQYCQSGSDCTGSSAHLCTFGLPSPAPTAFCTMLCNTDAGAAACGDQGAQCKCSSLACACVPARCLSPGLDQ